MVESQIQTVLTPWFQQLLACDPRPTLRNVKGPVLALNGEKDLQVAAKSHPRWLEGAGGSSCH